MSSKPGINLQGISPAAGKGAAEKTETKSRLNLAVIGIEAEFALIVDDEQVKPEEVFGDPKSFLRGQLMHRVGTSYHVPTGGAVYFDTGVIEVATPVIEIKRGCSARAVRSLWETILFIRKELDAWEQRTGHEARLVGFSSHYNISFERARRLVSARPATEELAHLLAYIMPVPVMLFSSNRRSTGVGVRPRTDRIEVTADFTPSAPLMVATATLITGIVREVMTWPFFDLGMLEEQGIPVIQGFQPIPHTSREGWLGRPHCYPQNPFTAEVDAPLWDVQPLKEDGRGRLSLREIAARIIDHFEPAIERIADPFTLSLLRAVLQGKSPSLLELPDRPQAYEDIGRLCEWNNLFPEQKLARSDYERVIMRAISGGKLWINGACYTPRGTRGWSEITFHRDADNTYHVFSIDYLLGHLDNWKES